MILFSAGAEEALQEGVRGFAHHYFPGLAREGTWFLNLDTVGSGTIVFSGENPKILTAGAGPGNVTAAPARASTGTRRGPG